jgi:hypothetical protein
MTRKERQRRETVASLLAMREMNDGVIAMLEAGRLRSVVCGSLFTRHDGGAAPCYLPSYRSYPSRGSLL